MDKIKAITTNFLLLTSESVTRYYLGRNQSRVITGNETISSLIVTPNCFRYFDVAALPAWMLLVADDNIAHYLLSIFQV